MESTGNCREISISVITAPPSPLPSSTVNQRRITMFLLLYIMTLLFLLELAMIRIKFEEDKQSPYKTHMVLMIISFVAYVIALLSWSLMYTQKYVKSLTIFEIICGFSGTLATLSLYLVMCLPENLIWVGYLVLSLAFMIAGACFWFLPKEKHVEARIQQEKISINYSLMIVPLTIVLMLHVPDSFNWIKLWVIRGTIVIVAAYNAIVYIKSSNKKVHNVEAFQVIQSNKTMA